jgi:hypothetical protein
MGAVIDTPLEGRGVFHVLRDANCAAGIRTLPQPTCAIASSNLLLIVTNLENCESEINPYEIIGSFGEMPGVAMSDPPQ